ncbi:MAG TPA: 50S ribosomal protein L9 [Gammaproteobacteria bacterium]|nr:50S ribosomal protein L9 [Gammaproteobacteria bacterium]
MEIILLERVRNLGNLGDQVSVKAGFARNYLIPKKIAVPATANAKKAFEANRVVLELKAADVLKKASAIAETLGDRRIVLQRKASEEGKLFGSVSAADIAEVLSDDLIAIQKDEVRLPEGALKLIGETEISVTVHPEVSFSVTVVVEAEG